MNFETCQNALVTKRPKSLKWSSIGKKEAKSVRSYVEFIHFLIGHRLKEITRKLEQKTIETFGKYGKPWPFNFNVDFFYMFSNILKNYLGET